jgi:orotate phosphoribosyltransferase
MEGGAFLGYAVADLLEAAFLPGYRTADGYRLAPPAGGISGWRVAIVDDAVNAGTAVRACAGLLREHGAVPVAVAALLAVGPARETLAAALPVPFHAVDAIESHAWRPADCPLCAGRVPLSDPAGPA